MDLHLKDLKPIQILHDMYGEEITMEEGSPTAAVYRILAEFALGYHQYAVLQTDKMKKDEEIALFHIVMNDHGELELETILDDEEWENVAEIYDEMTVSFDDVDVKDEL